MPKFLCLQRSLPTGESSGEPPTPAQMQAIYAEFGAWQEKFKPNLVDLGGRLGAGKLVAAEAPADGPFVEVKDSSATSTARSWRPSFVAWARSTWPRGRAPPSRRS